MNIQFLKKYQPTFFDDFTIDKEYIQLLKTLINMNNLNILLIGNSGSGKTSLLYATIREYYQLKDIPIIALTAHALETDRQKALAAGADDFDTKPVDIKRLLDKIANFT